MSLLLPPQLRNVPAVLAQFMPDDAPILTSVSLCALAEVGSFVVVGVVRVVSWPTELHRGT